MKMGRIIEVRGSAHEMGITQGKLLHDDIHDGWHVARNCGAIRAAKPQVIPHWCFLFATGLWTKKNLAITFEKIPEFRARFEGITKGSGLPEWQLALIHYLEVVSADSARQMMGCSSIAVLPPKSDEPLLAKNFDFVDEFDKFGILRKSCPRLGFSSVEFTMSPLAGAHTGFNETGLAITYNYGYSRERPQKSSLLTARVQEVLHTCETVRDSINILRRKPNLSSGIITVIDRSGSAVSIELSPGKTAVIEPESERRFLINANLFHSDSMRGLMIPAEAVYGKKSPHSIQGTSIQKPNIMRTERLSKLLTRYNRIDVDILKKILCDHGEDGIPSENTICRHHDNYSTHISAIIMPKSLKMLYCWGSPCKATQWHEIRL